MIVAIQQAGSAVGGNVNIRPAVIVEIGHCGSHAVRTDRLPVAADQHHGCGPPWTRDPGLFRNIDKRAVAAVVVENVSPAGKALGTARDGNIVVATVNGRAGLWRARGIVAYVIR